MLKDEKFMQEAFKEAKIAYNLNEVPVGAVLVVNDKIIEKENLLSETNSILISNNQTITKNIYETLNIKIRISRFFCSFLEINSPFIDSYNTEYI